MHRLPLAALVALVAAPAAPLAEDPAGGSSAPKAHDFESFQLVLLIRAPTWKKLPEAEAQALQAAHLGHLERMGKAGKAVVCGPFDDQADPSLRGACIYAVKTAQEARDLAGADPAVKAGQLRVEAVTWWVEKGYLAFPKAQPAERR